jgi:glycosyltransferase involved in cell wall biosynthesis
VLAVNPNADLYGASRMFLESVEGMLALGWRVVVTIPDPAGPLLEEIRRRGGEERPVPSPVLRKRYLSPRGILALVALIVRSLPAQIRLVRDVRPDVIYLNTIIQPLWLVLGRCLRVPVVCHVHEGEASTPRPVRKALALPLLLARRLIANSRFSRAVLVDMLPSVEARCVVVVNGVAGPPTVEAPRLEIDGPVRLLYLGRLSDRKGPADAIEAVRLLRERGMRAQLDIAGAVFPGMEHVEANLRRHVADAALADRVRFLGFTASVWPSLAASDVLVVPSRTDESFGNTAVEGLLAARPVVTTRIAGLVEATEGFGAVVTVEPSAPAEIADAVEQIVAAWPRFRDAALVDAAGAARRHSPAAYRQAVARAVCEVIAADALATPPGVFGNPE